MKIPSAANLSPERIARRSGSSFLVSFSSAESQRREALTAVYAFCRVVDDAADECANALLGGEELDYWQAELSAADGGSPRTPVGIAVQAAIQLYGVQRQHLQNVIDGVRFDLAGRPVADEDELVQYCYRVAGSVGLACLPVFGARGERAEEYAVELGHALQLTNILRDLNEDARDGRTYVPQTVLDRLGVEPEWLQGEGAFEVYRPDGPVGQLARWLVERARGHYERAEACVEPDQRRALLPAAIMGAVYFELLGKLEALGGSVCRARRVRLPSWRKLMIARSVRRRVLASA